MTSVVAPPRYADREINKLSLDIQAASSSLGVLDEDAYYLENDCKESIRDIIRCLRRDDDYHNLRRDLLRSRLVQTDLVPIIIYHSQDKDLFNLVTRLLMNLMNPPLLVYEEELPADKVDRHYYLELVALLQKTKEFFNDFRFWKIFRAKLEESLRVPVRERSEEQELVVERILILLRNVLHVPADPSEERTDDDASVHDQVVFALKKADFDAILMFLASSDDERELSLHVLEIISLMMREQNPAELAASAPEAKPSSRSSAVKDDDEAVLMAARARELELKRQTEAKYAVRRLRGTYQVKDVKGVGSREVIIHQPVAQTCEISFDKTKQKRRIPKNRFIPKEADPSERRRSVYSVRVFLRGFALEFLHGAYNSIMSIVKSFLDAGRAQANDESYYMWALRFFLEFNRSHKFRVDLVSETMSLSVLHYVVKQIDHYSDMMVTDKRKMSLWGKRLHLAVRAYHELLVNVGYMTASRDEVTQSAAKVIKGNIFYMPEFRDLLQVLLHRYNAGKLSVGYLKDLVEANHVYMKLLQDYTKNTSKIVIQRKIKRAKNKKPKGRNQPSPEEREQMAQEKWLLIEDKVRREIEDLNNSTEEFERVLPFDALLTDEAEQKADAVRRIRRSLSSEESIGDAIKMLRAARLLIPDGTFGPDDSTMSSEEEVLLLREIFSADIGPDDETASHAVEETREDETKDEEDEPVTRTVEKELEFADFVLKYANARVVENYAYLLRFYDTNAALTNHCIVKLFHRLAFDCKLPAVLFQASLFRTFQKIMRDPASCSVSHLKELAKFGIMLWRQFAAVARTNPVVFVELLFWKTHRDAVEITAGYGSYKSKSSGKNIWTEEQEDELQRLYDEFKGSQNPEKDVIQLVTENLIDRRKTARMVKRKLIEMGLIKGAPSRAGKVIRSKIPWSEEEVEELRRLWETSKQAMDPLSRLFEGLTLKRAKKRISEKLLELGLISSKAELSKKGKRRHRGEGGDGGDEEIGDSASSSSGDASSSEESVDEQETDTAPEEPAKVNPAVVAMGEDVLSRVKALLPVDGSMNVFKWLARSLRSAAEDVEETEQNPDLPIDFDGIALVPLDSMQSEFISDATKADSCGQDSQEFFDDDGEEASVAATVRGTNFYHLLKRFGYNPPAKGGQETYWRLHQPPKNPRNCSTALRLRADYLERAIVSIGEFEEVPDAKFFGEGFRSVEARKAEKARAKALKKMERRKLREEKRQRRALKKQRDKRKKSSSAASRKSASAKEFKSSEFVDTDESSDDEMALARVLGRVQGVEVATHAAEEREILIRGSSSLPASAGRSRRRRSIVLSNDEDVDVDRRGNDFRSSSSEANDSSEDERTTRAAAERKRESSAWKRTRRLLYSSDDGSDSENRPSTSPNKENSDPNSGSADTLFDALIKSTNDKQKSFDAVHARRKRPGKRTMRKRQPGADVVDEVALSSDDEGLATVQTQSDVPPARKRKILSDESSSSDAESSAVRSTEAKSSPSANSSAVKMRRITLEPDDDDDVVDVPSESTPAAVAIDSSDEDVPASKSRAARMVINSDSE